jgi:hypothetical protein
MYRKTWLVSIAIGVVGSVAADRPGTSAPAPAPAKRAVAQGQARKPTNSSVAPAAVPRASTPSAHADPRATSLFRSAQNLEKAGKKPGAIGLYRDVLIRYPESPEAPGSLARIKALGGKVPAPSEIRPAPPAEAGKFTRAPKPRFASQAANRAAVNQALGGMLGNAVQQPAGSGSGYGQGGYSP